MDIKPWRVCDLSGHSFSTHTFGKLSSPFVNLHTLSSASYQFVGTLSAKLTGMSGQYGIWFINMMNKVVHSEEKMIQCNSKHNVNIVHSKTIIISKWIWYGYSSNIVICLQDTGRDEIAEAEKMNAALHPLLRLLDSLAVQ
jgi:hypothetical protein